MSHRFFRYYTFVGHYLLLYGRTNNVVKRRAALCFAACQSKKALPAWFASVDADIRIGRRRHPHRSAQTSASVGADICIGRRRCINRRVWHPCHTHAATPRHTQPSPRSHMYAADCVGIARMLYPPTDCVGMAGMPYPPTDCVGMAGMPYPPIDSVGLTALPDIRA